MAITDVDETQAAFDKSCADLIGSKRIFDNAWEALRTLIGPVPVPIGAPRRETAADVT